MKKKPGPPRDSPSDAHKRFTDSMVMDLEKWREGTGYDLDVLRVCSEAEQASILLMLSTRVKSGSDEWRDIEALECLGGAKALEAIRAALTVGSAKTRLHAAETLKRMDQGDEVEEQILHALNHVSAFDGLSQTLAAAEDCPTPRVRAKLLERALNGDNRELRVNAAGLVLFLAGNAKEPFDWDHRPFFLRFGEDDRAERLAAYREMCERIGVEPTLK